MSIAGRNPANAPPPQRIRTLIEQGAEHLSATNPGAALDGKPLQESVVGLVEVEGEPDGLLRPRRQDHLGWDRRRGTRAWSRLRRGAKAGASEACEPLRSVTRIGTGS